ncbi:MAG TPA: hypothetical protein VMV47_02690 [Bacteroidales bacterium]|nr:hypothetical protein [Bacteroidales bacterium]
MKTLSRTLMIKLLILLPGTLIIQSYPVSARLPSRELKEEAWKFPKKDTLCLETMGKTKVFITGSNSGEIEIKLRYIVKPDEKFEVKESQRTIYLKENILNYNKHRPTQTYFEECTWIITVPHGMYIRCSGSSGEFEVKSFIGVFKANYGQGRFNLNNVDGSIDLRLAMLKAKIHNSKGSFNLSSAGGSIRTKDLTVNGKSSFSTGMGVVKISLAREPEADLYVSSSFNKAQVRFNGHPVTGYFEFIAMEDGGRINSPFKFDKVETFLDDIKNYNTSSDFGKKDDYYRKSFIRGDSTPKITLKTVTGIAKLTK